MNGYGMASLRVRMRENQEIYKGRASSFQSHRGRRHVLMPPEAYGGLAASRPRENRDLIDGLFRHANVRVFIEHLFFPEKKEYQSNPDIHWFAFFSMLLSHAYLS